MRKQRNVYEVENMRGRKQDTLHTDKFEAYVKTICLKGRDGETRLLYQKQTVIRESDLLNSVLLSSV